MSDLLKCMKTNLPTHLYELVSDQYAILLKNAAGDMAMADVALKEWLPTFRDNFKRARLGHVLKGIEVNANIDRQLTRLQTNWDAMKPKAQAWARLTSSQIQPTYANATELILANADLNARAQSNTQLGKLAMVYDKIAAKGFQLDADRSIMGKVLAGMIDGIDSVTDPVARNIIKELREVMDNGLVLYRQAGGQIGEIKNYVPIKHNASKIKAVSFDVWFPAYRDMTNINKVTDFSTGKLVTEARFKEIAKDMFDDIRTDGASRAKRQLDRTSKTVSFKNPDMFSRRMQARLSSPKNAAAFKRYNDKFGIGDEGMYDLIVSNIEGIARDAGVMQVMGPMPYAQADGMARKIIPNGGTPQDVKRIEGLFRTLVGHWEGSIDSTFSRFGTNMQNFMSSALLGAAPVAALGDRVFIKNAIRLNGLVNGKELDAFFSGLAGNPDEILRTLHIAEALSHQSISRFDGEIANTAMGKFGTGLNNFKNMNHRITGLQNITLATGDALSMSFFATVGEQIQKSVGWSGLNADFRNLMEVADVNETDWARLVANGVDERGLVTPAWLPDNMSEVARKLDVVNLQLRTYATNSPDLRQRMYTTGNRFGSQVRGDYPQVIASAVLQFKSFPMMVWRNHFVPTMTRALGGDAAPMVTMMMGAMFYGTLIVQAKELLKGNDIRAWDDPALYMKAFVQSGAAGLIGDAWGKDPTAYGRNLVEELAGPSASSLSAALMAANTMLWEFAAMDDDTNMDWGAVTRAGKPFLPLGTVWYARAAIDHLFWDMLTGALDDDYYENTRRKNEEMQKERGSAGWYKKGDALPQF